MLLTDSLIVQLADLTASHSVLEKLLPLIQIILCTMTYIIILSITLFYQLQLIICRKNPYMSNLLTLTYKV
ncbi:hypothetical protein L873DRAFT_1276384 [Choiromyces venosus 120613-1]|uniref:Uncharacterized protein n=1 Tax=Choiromyces venosus 120613-1 TaxID=1336337 RepID=A0A3N4K255_9PEZI|nr:hypothetical protein L873DRAFT_1276384 [Choiromyces venosus 120613-1]